ncbi:MAG: methyltransferase domain-containing protein [Apibacter sp.]|uniref:Methyltransferase domain-containing protein n=1 Tax=Apibacter mensalis TaxID=1586267 RepID=A0A0X3ANP1_9FLAO|nr:class I SAM-dependent methyltransferase [Apibacter mensalis]MCO6565063.1 methyltransferase domain-containing protein [Apibacter sp.]CVK15665.1 Methyltransferase domain-containing protein [Apibacter mensalis]
MDWFAEWFNTPYYHILYKNRDDKEAQEFITNLLKYLNLPAESKILDLACGKGRHSIFFNKLGYDVTGVDLASKSIKYAKEYENEHLKFFVGDMRKPNFPNHFNAIFNLFTSFGYFSDDIDNLKVYQSIFEQLLYKGIFVMDFMNVSLAMDKLITQEDKEVDGILFHLQRKIENGFIIKDIKFQDQGENFHFQERVRTFNLDYFENLGKKVGFSLNNVFGDYQLHPFNEKHSPRLILIFEK